MKRVRLLERGCFLGHSLGERSTESFGLLESDYAPGAELGEHRHERPYLSLVLAGSYVEESRRGRVHCSAGTSQLHLAGDAHADRIGSCGARILNVEFEPGLLADWEGVGCGAEPRIERSDDGHALRVHAEFLCGDRASPLSLEALVWELLERLLRPPALRRERRPSWLGPVEERLRESSELPTLRELAAAAGVHPAHLTRVFRRAHGCSVGDWYRARRIERAAQELLLGESSLADVALRHGFCDQSHFNRVFGRLVGTSPGRYRSRTRAGRAAWMR